MQHSQTKEEQGYFSKTLTQKLFLMMQFSGARLYCSIGTLEGSIIIEVTVMSVHFLTLL